MLLALPLYLVLELVLLFFMWWANKTGDLTATAYATRTTIADLLFTTPTVIIQPVSGIILVNMLVYNYFDL
nr:DUF2269 family protein [Rickettsia conorii]